MGHGAAPTRAGARLRRALDTFFFIFAGLASFWFAWLLLIDAWRIGWWGAPVLVLFWGTLAYFALPRLHRILTSIYVPNYFIGRTRTSDGLLGDPINLALIGSEEQVHAVMRAAGWTQADDLNLRSGIRIVTSTLTRRSYDEAPVSPLLLFEREQDFAYQQEVAGNPAKRHHVRFWKCPDGWLLPGGHRVDWLAAGTYDRAVGLSLFTLQITHKIDEDTDVERDHIVATVVQSGTGAQVYLLKDFSTGYHARNGGGDSINTDGDLPVIDVRPVAGGSAAEALPRAVRERVTHVTRAPSPRRRHARKRAAYEVPAPGDLLEASVAEQVRRHGRPAYVTVGVALVALRALVTAVLVVGFILSGPDQAEQLLAGFAIRFPELQAMAGVYPSVIAAGILLVSIEVAVAVLLARGSDVARIVVLATSAFWTIATLVDWGSDGRLSSEFLEMGGVGLSILALFALSSAEARHYCQARPGGGPQDR